MRKQTMCFAALAASVLSIAPAFGGSLIVYETTPLLADTTGSVAGNLTQSAPGFGDSSWQATQHNPNSALPSEQKSNFYVTPEELFGTSVTIGDVASMSYWTDQFNSGGNSNWSLYIYTVPTGSGWYGSRLVASPGIGDANAWDQWNTATPTPLTFSDPTRNGGAYTTSITWSDLVGGPVHWDNGPAGNSRDYSTEQIKYFSLQTASNDPDFRGLVDGLQITLTNGQVGNVNLEATPEPGTYLLFGTALAGIGLLRRKARR